MKTAISCVKATALLAFLVLLFTTYYLRSEVLMLNRIRFSAYNVGAEERIKELKESYPLRMAEHGTQKRNYDIKMKHYMEMMELYNTDYNEYVKRIKDRYVPPQLPPKPKLPRSPEISDKLASINADFRNQQFLYFDRTKKLNWIACSAALMLVGSLIFLLMFDTEGKKVFYVILLALSFVFMIGPSFHSILSTSVGFLKLPRIF